MCAQSASFGIRWLHLFVVMVSMNFIGPVPTGPQNGSLPSLLLLLISSFKTKQTTNLDSFFLLHISVCSSSCPAVILSFSSSRFRPPPHHIHFACHLPRMAPKLSPTPAHLLFLPRTRPPAPVPEPPAGVPWVSSSDRCSLVCSPACSSGYAASPRHGPEPLWSSDRHRGRRDEMQAGVLSNMWVRLTELLRAVHSQMTVNSQILAEP